MSLRNKKILLGVSGSIAAYKIAVLVRLLIKQEAEVRVVMTTSASAFITPLTLSTLSKNPVYIHFEKNKYGEWVNHVELALWADIIVIAPATANTIAKLSHGICEQLLHAIVLSSRCPVFVAPAMDLDMLVHPSTTHNIQQLNSYGYHIIASDYGELASGLVGDGRMAEPENILLQLEQYFAKKNTLAGYQVLITAGPTQEAIDPVRYISNHSSGKMGYALAAQAAQLGAAVILVSGPVHIKATHPNIRTIAVTTAQEMLVASQKYFEESKIVILCAAVADYKTIEVEEEKIKKDENHLDLKLEKTADIALQLGSQKLPNQVVVGFALETSNELENAKLKLKKKNLDLIVLNSTKDEGATFKSNYNKITIIDDLGNVYPYPLKEKNSVAVDILDQVILRLKKQQ